MERVLIVEGEEDEKFFKTICREIGAGVQVNVRVQVQEKRGKPKAIETFGDQLAILSAASDARVGLVVDADQQAVNATDGFVNTRATINERLAAGSFNPLTHVSGTSGLLSTSNSRPRVKLGAWIMPDNKSDGYLEHFISHVIADAESDRHQFAAATARKVADGQHGGPTFSFRKHHLPKAELGTWLAWSDPPRMSLGAVASAGMLDRQKPPFQDLMQWLRLLYL
jgi:hypothetical protein